MGLSISPDAITVEMVVAGGLANRGGLKTGDVIRAINGQSVDQLDSEGIGKLLRTQPIQLVVLRDGHEMELTLGSNDD